MGEKRELGLASWALIITSASLLSRILGFMRNMVISTLFGQNRWTDMLNASFVLPDTLYLILVGGGISSAFVPVLSGYLAEKKEREAGEVVSIAFNLVLVVVGLAVTLSIFFSPFLVRLIAPGFNSQEISYTAYLTRVVLMAILFHSLNGVLMGTEYAYQSFLGTTIGPLVYNAAIIIFGTALASRLGIAAFAWSTLLGAFLNFLVQVWGVWRLRIPYLWSWNFRHPAIRRIGELMLPVTIGLSIAQINLFLNQTFIASFLPPGSINALTLASRVVLVPMLFAPSLGITLLPTLTRLAVNKEREAFERYLVMSLSAILFIALPATAGFIVLGEQVIRVLFEHGRFTRQDTLATANALVYYSLGIAAYGAYEMLSRAFYALQDTRTPLKVGLLTLGVGTSFNFLLGPLWGVKGLALAYSLAGWFNVALLFYLLKRRGIISGSPKVLGSTLVKSLIGAIFMGGCLKILTGRVTLFLTGSGIWTEGLKLLLLITGGAVLYITIAWLLRMEELGFVTQALKGPFRRRRAGLSEDLGKVG
ncbi:putative peptidoglycan lipid II flippase [Thermanaeromonas toyohensis ToBE]|uniref:Probable lipid II flippase MurJ n=1 Tax=Thermanaeromonas toyohensis ToBE TaxID=698762 RepID=A0A1W1VQC5_9FIRM|nr:murein biosynthesis integral membrane protein MurJ [Thermanaeromonas toyohensis]SMB95430.1 putative peptidoglycan lipid II flippase [Thermanaeromonas toyohensis ToBE]